MVDILQRFGIAAEPHQVYESLTTLDGLSSWWTRDVTGDPTPGGTIEFTFGGPDRTVRVEVISAVPDEQVIWRCVHGPDEWLDTTMEFELQATETETVVRFAHAGWREPVEFMGHCTTKWASFLLGLKNGLEAGQATPFPADPHISSWDDPQPGAAAA
jgi:uncharacterized protein YndB with AHSA1/START domain